MTIDEQLRRDRDIYGMSFERLVNGKRERLDPTTVKCVTVKNKKEVVDMSKVIIKEPIYIFENADKQRKTPLDKRE